MPILNNKTPFAPPSIAAFASLRRAVWLNFLAFLSE